MSKIMNTEKLRLIRSIIANGIEVNSPAGVKDYSLKLTPVEEFAVMSVLAAWFHMDTTDKGGHPYVLHPQKVAYKVSKNDYQLKAIALGHDLVEECKEVTYELFYALGFSNRVIFGIRDITKVAGESPSRYKQKVLSNDDSADVKIQDLDHNLQLNCLKGVTPDDMKRVEQYHTFYAELDEARKNRYQ